MSSFNMIDALFLMAARGDQLRDFPTRAGTVSSPHSAQYSGPTMGVRKRPYRSPSLPIPLPRFR